MRKLKNLESEMKIFLSLIIIAVVAVGGTIFHLVLRTETKANNTTSSSENSLIDQRVVSFGNINLELEASNITYALSTENFELPNDKQVEITQNTARVTDTYPWKNSAIGGNDPMLFENRECVSYVGWKINERYGLSITDITNHNFFWNHMPGPNGLGNSSNRWGSATNWRSQANDLGYAYTNEPEVGSIAWWDFGHVAYVEELLPNNQIRITEYNLNFDHIFTERIISRNNPTGYIHIFAPTLLGTKNQNGNFISANVSLTSNNKTFTVQTNSDGQYLFNELPLGPAQLSASAGVETTSGNVYINYGFNIINVTLKSGVCTSESRKSYEPNSCVPPEATDSSDFLTDITIPDGQVMPPNNPFTKIWRLKNNGTTTWNSGYKIAFQSGTRMGAQAEVAINQTVVPGATVDVAVGMVAPSNQGSYSGYWIMKNSSGATFGDLVWVIINVQSGSTPPDTGGQVKLFAGVNYTNLIKAYGPGEYNDPSANSYSIEIPSGWSVITYRSDGFSGQERCWYQSVPNLQDHEDWQNKIQSIKVFNYQACGGGGKVRLYSQPNFDNQVGPDYGLGRTQEPNNTAVSMRVPAGWSVKTYRNNDFGGGERCWSADVTNFQDHESWHRDVDSMEVFPTNVCGGTSEAHEVRLYSDTGHKGTNIVVTSDIPHLSQTPIGNDNVRSFRIYGDWYAVLYEHSNYEGRSVIRNSGENDAGALPWGYGTSSIRVRKKSPDLVSLYDLGDYNGEKFSTDRSLPNVYSWQWADRAESVRVKPGYEAIICNHSNFHGICGRTKTDKADLNAVANGLRGQVASIQICVNECGPTPVVPTLTSPLDQISFVPGSNVTFAWDGNATEYHIEVWGGALPNTVGRGWHPSNTYSIDTLPFSNNPYFWRVRGWNQFGEGGWSPTKSFYIRDIIPQTVHIFGENTTQLNKEITLTAFVNPTDATNLTYNWNPQPISGQGTTTAKFKWDTAGVKQVSLSVSNPAGSAQKTHTVTIDCSNNQYFVEYFNNKNLNGESISKLCEDTISHDWDLSGPTLSSGQDLTINSGIGFKVDQIKSKITGGATVQSKTITVNNSSGFQVGDTVLIIQMSGGANAGNYERNTIESIQGNNLNTKNPLKHSYEFTNTSKSQILKIPQYNNVTIKNDAMITADPWDEVLGVGGIIVFDASGEVTIEPGGSIDISAAGFKGGLGGNEFPGSRPDTGSTAGSYINSVPLNGPALNSGDCGDCISPAGPSNGGGGIGGRGARSLDSASGGGGGSYGTRGNQGTTVDRDPYAPGGLPGETYGTADLSKLYLGSGGGGGGKGKDGYGDAGAPGGGIIFVKANKINIKGGSGIASTGGPAGNNGSGNAGGGGGGSGGSVLLEVGSLISTEHGINVNGREGSSGNYGGNGRPGGKGGLGRARIKYCESATGFSGSTITTEQTTCPVDNFSARWTKRHQFESGKYKFNINSDDGVRVWINDDLIVDKWVNGHNVLTVEKTLPAGEHSIKVEYFENDGYARMHFDFEKIPNQPPVLTQEIADQTISGTTLNFNQFDLDDYATDEGVITWTITGNSQLVVNKNAQNVVSISRPSASWGGEEIINFKATDEFGESVSTTAKFKAIANNTAPTITQEIPDQTISGSNLFFTNFDLDDYGSDQEGPVTWSISGYQELEVSKNSLNVVSIKRPNAQWKKEETLTFKITDAQGLFATTTARFRAVNNNQPPVITNPIPDQTITGQDATFDSFDLDNHGSDDGNYSWSVTGNTELGVNIDSENVVSITRPQNWVGEEELTFTIIDDEGLEASTKAKFKATTQSLIIGEIPDQTIQGDTLEFTPIQLDHYVENAADTTWSFSGNKDLIVNIDSENEATIKKPFAEWFGEEQVIFKADDVYGQSDTTTVLFKAVNDVEVVKIGWTFKKSNWESRDAKYGGVTNPWIHTQKHTDSPSDFYALDWVWGDDIQTCGQKVMSAISGKVIFVGNNKTVYKKQIVIQSDKNPNYAWKVAYLKELNVAVGDKVTTDTVIGTAGGSPEVTKCSVHTALYQNLNLEYSSGVKGLDRLKQGLDLNTANDSQNEPNMFAAQFENSSKQIGGEVPHLCVQAGQEMVTLFKGNNCKKDSKVFETPGAHNLGIHGIEKAAKSIFVKDGYSIRIYKGLNKSGNSKCFSTTVEKLSKATYDNGKPIIKEGKSTISSIEIFTNNNCSPVQNKCSNINGNNVNLYKDSGCNELIGSHTEGSPVIEEQFNDATQSIYVPQGMSVKVFEHPGFSGFSKCISSTADNLAGVYFDEGEGTGNMIAGTISSVTIYNNSTCADNQENSLEEGPKKVQKPVEPEPTPSPKSIPITSYPESYPSRKRF